MGGGGGKSTSTTSSSNAQTQTDSRQAVQGGTAVGAGGSNTSTTNNTTSTSYSDSHALSDSGNTTYTFNGTDQGAVQLGQLAMQFASADGEQNLQALSSLENLQAVGQQNLLTSQTHTVDVIGDLMGQLVQGATAVGNAGAFTANEANSAQATNQKTMLIVAGIVAGAIVLAKVA